MGVTVGSQLASYEVIALLGKGGFGEVYRAKDRKLKRDVAIKILPDEFSADPERLSATGMGDVHLLALDADTSSVGLIDSVENFNKRRLAGAVLT